MNAWFSNATIYFHGVDDFLISYIFGSLKYLIPSPNIIVNIFPKIKSLRHWAGLNANESIDPYYVINLNFIHKSKVAYEQGNCK